MDDITETLSRYIAAEILKQPDRTLKEAEPLISSGLIDSFSLVDLSMFVEEKFGVRLEDTELNVQTFDSLAQLAGLIRQRQGA
jgi:acyl carrier protein